MAGREKLTGTLIATAATVLLAAPSAGAVIHRVDHAGSADWGRKAAGYWTPARMRNAIPLDVALPAAQAPSDPAQGFGPTPRSATGGGFNAGRTIAPQLPDATARARAARIRAPKYIAGPVALQSYTTFPFSANGKLFFTQRGNSYVCSATSVASKSRSVVLTAGHCVHDKGAGWSHNIAFVPAYWNGGTPFGTWPALHAVAPRAWVRKENFSADYAALKVPRSFYGPLSKIVGGVGLAWGQPRRQTFLALGYPNNLYSGQAMYACISRSAGKDPFQRGPGPPDTGIGCNMSHGASGGSWMIGKRSNGKQRPFINSVTSYRYNQRPNLLFGPYFTKSVRNLVRATSRR